MAKNNIIGSTADREMDIFWESYKKKLDASKPPEPEPQKVHVSVEWDTFICEKGFECEDDECKGIHGLPEPEVATVEKIKKANRKSYKLTPKQVFWIGVFVVVYGLIMWRVIGH